MSCTAVRIPTLRAHSEAITIETEKPVTVDAARAVLSDFPGLKLSDDVDKNLYPMPITSTGNYDVEVGRIRRNDVFGENGLDFFICGSHVGREALCSALGRLGGGVHSKSSGAWRYSRRTEAHAWSRRLLGRCGCCNRGRSRYSRRTEGGC